MQVTKQMHDEVMRLVSAAPSKSDTDGLIAYAVFLENDVQSDRPGDLEFLEKFIFAARKISERRYSDPDSAPYSMYDYLDAIVNGTGLSIIDDIWSSGKVTTSQYCLILKATEYKRRVYSNDPAMDFADGGFDGDFDGDIIAAAVSAATGQANTTSDNGGDNGGDSDDPYVDYL